MSSITIYVERSATAGDWTIFVINKLFYRGGVRCDLQSRLATIFIDSFQLLEISPHAHTRTHTRTHILVCVCSLCVCVCVCVYTFLQGTVLSCICASRDGWTARQFNEMCDLKVLTTLLTFTYFSCSTAMAFCSQ